VVETLRLALVLKAAPAATLAELTPAERDELRQLGERVSLDEILYVLRALLDADEMMRESPHPRVELEIATVRSTRRPVPQALEEILRRVDEAEARLRGAGFAEGGPAPAAPVQQSILDSPPEPPRPASPAAGPAARAPRAERGRGSMGAAGPTSRPAPAPASLAVPAGKGQQIHEAGGPAAVEAGAAPPREVDESPASVRAPSDLAEAWQRVTEDVTGKRALLGAVLAQVRPAGLEGCLLTLVLAGNQFHRDRLLEPMNQDILGQAVRRWVTGAERFTIVMEGEADGGPRAHPTVQAAIAEFQGEIVAVRARSPEGDAS
jgi:hypothetical protein